MVRPISEATPGFEPEIERGQLSVDFNDVMASRSLRLLYRSGVSRTYTPPLPVSIACSKSVYPRTCLTPHLFASPLILSGSLKSSSWAGEFVGQLLQTGPASHYPGRRTCRPDGTGGRSGTCRIGMGESIRHACEPFASRPLRDVGESRMDKCMLSQALTDSSM
jgi:hypothetical protein